jgi:hypothetical protein
MRRRPLAARLFVFAATALSAVVSSAPDAAAQVIVSPNAEPVRNDGGWIYWVAIALVALGVIVTIGIVLRYMRNAPRWQREEGGPRVVKAPRIQPGREAPRRSVNITGAPAVVPAPAAAAAAAPAPVPAPAAVAPVAPAAPAPAAAPGPAAASPPAPAPAAAAAGEGGAPEGATSEASPVATEPAAAPAPSGERKEVALDQETFDRVLAELLEKGTARRVAEGQARRAAMIAARKKAGA